jgi:Rab proteins geranylgeranyltransferase component A
VVYGSTSLPGSEGQTHLEAAVTNLLEAFAGVDENPTILWSLRFTQLGLACEDDCQTNTISKGSIPDRMICLPPLSLDIAFDDKIIDAVKAAWKTILGNDVTDAEFMNFDDRVGLDDE